LTEQPGRVTRVVSHASDVAVCCCVADAGRIDSWRLGSCGTDGVAIADYRIICVFQGANGSLQAVGYSESGNAVMYDDVWTIEQARHAIEKGHRLYTVSPSTGEEADVELYGDGIRTKPDQSTDNTLDDLPRRG
jgi:hypothetical protein